MKITKKPRKTVVENFKTYTLKAEKYYLEKLKTKINWEIGNNWKDHLSM